MQMYHIINTIRSNLHEIGGHELNKVSLSCFDDKRYIHNNGVTCYAYGHYEIYSQNLLTKFTHKIYSQNLLTKFTHKIYSQNLLTKFTHKIYSQNLLTKFTHKIYSQNLLTKCSRKISSRMIGCL